jgi:cysteine desulfurase
MEPIYLDNNATTPMLPEVADAMAACRRDAFANPASQHGPGRRARALLEEAREGIGELVGARTTGMAADRVIFTSGGTESNNLALRGLGSSDRRRLIVSAIEHPSIAGTAEQLRQQGQPVDVLPAGADGVVRADLLSDRIDDDTRLVSIMLGNNETGVLQPVERIAEIAHEREALVHTDAVQVVGKLPVDFQRLGVDALTCAAHKFHGPRGIGALIVRHGTPLQPLLLGGFQQAGLRPGTESVELAVGMFEALRVWHRQRDARRVHLTDLRDRLESGLRAEFAEVVVVGEPVERLPHTSCVAFPGVDRQALAMALDLAGVAISTGSACASGSSEPSATLVAMGCDRAVIAGAIRLSVGACTTRAEVDSALGRIVSVAKNLQARKKRSPASR